jgi:dipeptidyl aminopeptidase/acylaminoacyl peptidase
VLADGGFDPVGIEAAAGDRLQLSLFQIGDVPVSYVVVVPPRRNPAVVRTNPAKGRVDVALNVQVEVVFSEPVDKTTVSSSTIVLQGPNGAVAGSVTVSPDGLSATLIPAQELEGSTDYNLSVTAAIRDLDGDPLAETTSLTFSTVVGPPTPISLEGKILFNRGYVIWRANADGSGEVNLTGYAWWGNFGGVWSPDGKEIAFLSSRNGVPPCPACPPAGSGIYVMKEDGSKVVRVSKSGNSGLAWSPDGRKLAYTTSGFDDKGQLISNAIAIIDVALGDASAEYLPLPANLYPTNLRWSPDGKYFAFGAWDPKDEMSYHPWGSIYLINADGSNLRKLLVGGDGTALTDINFPTYEAFSWSPNGKRISVSICALEIYGYLEACDVWHTAIGSFDGANVNNLQLVHTGEYAAGGSWSPDGEIIAVDSRDGVLYVTRDGRQLGPIVKNGGGVSWHR